MKRTPVLLIAAILLLVHPNVAGAETISIRAYIDGVSRLHLSGETAIWHHLDFQAPGLFDGAHEPTTINGIDWYASFPSAWCSDCWSDTFMDVVPPLPAREFSASLIPIEARELVSIVDTPSAANGYTLVIEFNDNESPGAAWYEIVLEFDATCDLLFAVPVYDGQTWVHNCDLQVNGVVVPEPGCPEVTEIQWDWGDGSVNASWFPAYHTYGANARYEVTATAIDDSGETVAESVQFDIDGCEPLPSAPGGVADGLALWLAADAGVVHWNGWSSRWFDQSGNGRNLTQWSNTWQPELVEEVINGHDVLRFDLAFFPFDGNFLVESDYTVFAVEGRDRFGVANFFIGGGAMIPNGNLVLGYENESTLRQAHYANDLDAAVPAYVGQKEFALTGFRFDRTSGRSISRFGDELASDTSTQPLISYDSPTVGSFPAFGYFYTGDIAELIFFDRVLSCPERAGVELYLAGKYGLALAYSDELGLCAETPIVDLAVDVALLDLEAELEEALTTKLTGAVAVLDDPPEGNDHAAINKLGAFVNQIEAQRGHLIPVDDADALIAGAEEVIAYLTSLYF